MKQLRRLFERELGFLGKIRRKFKTKKRLHRTLIPSKWPSISLGWSLSILFHGFIFVLIFQNIPEKPTPGKTERWINIKFYSQPLVAKKNPPEPKPKIKNPPTEIKPELDREQHEKNPARPLKEETPTLDKLSQQPAEIASLSDLQAPPLPSSNTITSEVIGIGPKTPSSISATRDGSELFGNRGEGRAKALKTYGGNRGTEDAVLRGLTWLAHHQDKDGKWDADGFNKHCTHLSYCFGKGQDEFDVGISALALLAFLGAGFSPASHSQFQETVLRGFDYLLASQTREGRFGSRSEKFFYNHALASFAMAEAYGMNHDPRLLRSAAKSLKYSSLTQQPGGGWDYTNEITGRNDLSITGWQVMAIHTAQKVGIPFSGDMLKEVKSYLERSVTAQGRAEYANIGLGSGRRGVAMAAVNMLSRLYLGVSPEDGAIRGAAGYLIKNPPELEKTYDWERYYQSSYYWYYGTLAMFHIGGQRWEAWNHFLKQSILPMQSSKPHEDGSWDPDANWIGAIGGRIAATAFQVLSLEVYYRYPPLHAYRN